MIWVILVFTHLFSLTIYTILLRQSTFGKLHKLFIAALMQTSLFLPALFFLIIGKISWQHPITDWILLLCGSTLLAGYMIANVWALSKLDASVFTLLFNLRVLVITVLGYMLLHEVPSTIQIIGGLIIFVGIVVLHFHKNAKWRSEATLVGLFTMFWFSLHAILEKYNLTFWRTEDYIFFFNLFATLILWLVLLVRRVNIRDQLKHTKSISFLGLLISRSLSAYSYIYALAFGSLAITSYVSSMSVVLIVLFGIYMLGEHTHIRRKLFAAAIACVGLTIILYGKLFV